MIKRNLFLISIVFAILISTRTNSFAESSTNNKISIYKVFPDLLDNYETFKKGTDFNLTLLNNIDSKTDNVLKPVAFETSSENLKVIGEVSKISNGKRFSNFSNLQLSTRLLELPDGNQVYFSSTSPEINAQHFPHANSSSLGLARTISGLSFAATPITFGASLGISFLASGLLSAYQNGISDFFWGGCNGSGFPFVETLFRKQPEIYLTSGSTIPFTLTDDLKISKGIEKEDLEKTNISKEEAEKDIQALLKRGDIAGALELSVKTNQEESYKKIMKEISPQG